MNAVTIGSIAVGVGVGAGSLTLSRDGINYAQTHDLRRRPAPSTVWNSMGKILLSSLGGIGLMAGALKMQGSAAAIAYGVGMGLAAGSLVGLTWGMTDGIELRPGQRKLAPGYG